MKSNLRKIYLIRFSSSLAFAEAITIPFFIEWGGLNYTQIFILQGYYMLLIVLLEVPTGTVADKVSRKLSLTLAGVFLGIGGLIYCSIPNFYIFMVAESFWALGAAFSSGSTEAIIYDTLKKEKEERQAKYIFANLQIVHHVAAMISLPAGSLIAGMMLLPYPRNLIVPAFLSACTKFIGAITALFVKEPERKIPRENHFQLAKSGLKHLVKHKALRALSLNMALISGITFTMFWLYQPLLGSVDVDIKFYGFVGVGAYGFGIILLSNIKRIEKLFSIKNIIFLTAIVPGITFLLLGIYSTLWVAVVGPIFILSFRHLRSPLFKDYMNRYIKSENRATVLSSISMLETLIMAIAFPVIGLLLDWSINYTLLILGFMTITFALVTGVEERLLK